MNYKKIKIGFSILLGISVLACSNSNKKESKFETTLGSLTNKTFTKTAKPLSEVFKKYWYSGTAEISSYELEQARYGEIRKGNAVLIYVTEDFLPKIQVKADRQNPINIPILKLNNTKKFLTGIYPYSVMQSVFYPVANNTHAIKVSSSMQEWCGHVYMQLNNRNKFNIKLHSYFQGEADQELYLSKTVLENELWTKIRIDPTALPIGTFASIPSFEFIRLKHIPIRAYGATASLTKKELSTSYKINYPELERSLKINFNTYFPYEILGWEETFNSGGKQLTTKATRKKTINPAYWGQNTNADLKLRDTLQL